MTRTEKVSRSASLRRPPTGAWRSSPSAEGVAFAIGSGLAQIASAAFFIIAARSVGPTEFGVAAACLGLATWATTLVDFGNSSYVLREVVANHLPKTSILERLFGRLILLGGLSVLAAVVSIAISNPLPVLVAAISLARCASLGLSTGLRSFGSAGIIILVSIFEPTVSMAAFSVLRSLEGPPRVLAAVSIGASASSLAYAWFARERIGRPSGRIDFSWRDAADFGVFGIAVGATDLDVVLIGTRVSTIVAGEYSAISRWTRPITLLTQSFLFMAVPRIASAESSRAAFNSVRSAIWILGAGVALSISLAAFSEQLVSVLLGEQFAGSAQALRVLAVAAAIGIPTQFMAIFLMYRHESRGVSRIQVISTVIQLGLVVPISKALGAIGPGLAILVSRLAALGLLAATARSSAKREHGQSILTS